MDELGVKRLAYEPTNQRVKRMNLGDLEKLVLEKVVEVVLATSNLGKMARELEKISAKYIRLQVKASTLQKQVNYLQTLVNKMKICNNAEKLCIPKIEITNSIDSTTDHISNSLVPKSEVINLVVDTSCDSCFEKSLAQEDVPEVKSKPNLANGQSILKPQVTLKFDQGMTEIKDSENLKSVIRRQSVEKEPVSLSVKKSSDSDRIVFALQKNLETFQINNIINYELEVCEESQIDINSNLEWSKIAKELHNLPLGCHRSNFKTGSVYYFRVKFLMAERCFYSNVSSITI